MRFKIRYRELAGWIHLRVWHDATYLGPLIMPAWMFTQLRKDFTAVYIAEPIMDEVEVISGKSLDRVH